MKTLTVQEAQTQLSQLIAEANRGQLIVLTDGDNKVTLHPGGALDLDEDSPELEAELLRAVTSPHAPLRDGELREIADRALSELRTQRKE